MLLVVKKTAQYRRTFGSSNVDIDAVINKVGGNGKYKATFNGILYYTYYFL